MRNEMKNAVVLSCDERLVFALGNVLFQLKEYNFIDDIVIYFKYFDKQLNDKLLKISPKVKIIEFKEDDVINYLKFDLDSNFFMKVYGYMPFVKFLALDLIEQYDNIMLLDVDVLILKDFSFVFSSYPIAYKSRGYLHQLIECPRDYTLPNGGVVVINKTILDYISNPKIVAFDLINEFCNKASVDEIALGYMVYKYNLPLRLLNDFKVNVSPISKNSLDSVIVHGASPYKFWTHSVASFLFPLWRRYNKIWNNFCNDNDLEMFMFQDCIDDEINPEILSNMYFAITVHKHIWNCHHDLRICVGFSNIIKIFIKDIPFSIHFEIIQSGNNYKLMLHDETSQRNDISLSKFSAMLAKINLIARAYPNRFEGAKVINLNLLNKELNHIYNALKGDLYQYALFYKS